MIKMLGITKEPITMNVDSPPKFYRKVSTKPIDEGVFGAEVYKLKSFNKFTKEATYVRQRDQKLKSRETEFTSFAFSSTKTNSYSQED